MLSLKYLNCLYKPGQCRNKLRKNSTNESADHDETYFNSRLKLKTFTFKLTTQIDSFHINEE